MGPSASAQDGARPGPGQLARPPQLTQKAAESRLCSEPGRRDGRVRPKAGRARRSEPGLSGTEARLCERCAGILWRRWQRGASWLVKCVAAKCVRSGSGGQFCRSCQIRYPRAHPSRHTVLSRITASLPHTFYMHPTVQVQTRPGMLQTTPCIALGPSVQPSSMTSSLYPCPSSPE